jgi:DNA-binding MarR family transcriptional regulator
MTRWLNEQERAAWLRLAAVMLKLTPALDSELQRDSGLTHFDYLTLAMLSEAENRTLTMSELAAVVNSSLSRLSHVITKLEGRGWVERRPSPDSRRVTMARLTEAGWKVVVAAAPGHVEAVRELVFDGMSDEDVAALERVAGHIAKRLEETDLKTTS